MSGIRRTAEEKIEDNFCDLELSRQAAVLDSLAKLNRWCKRERNRSKGEEAAVDQQSFVTVFYDQAEA